MEEWSSRSPARHGFLPELETPIQKIQNCFIFMLPAGVLQRNMMTSRAGSLL